MATAADQRRAAQVDAAVRLVMTRGPRAGYAGNAAVQVKPDFFHIPEPEPRPRTSTQRDAPFPARPVKKNPKLREGAHVGHNAGLNPLKTHPLDPLAEQILKVKDPVAYHVYKNQRPWITQSSLIGEHHRVGQPGARLPTAPVGGSPNKRETLRMLRATATRAIGDNAKPGDMEAVSPSRAGYVPPPARQPGDMTTQAQQSFINPKTLPEPPTCKAPRPQDRPFFSKHPTDTSARDAVDHMCNLDGTLKSERPDKVHPSVWARVQRQEKALSVGGDPHAHKHHTPGWMGTIGGTVVA